MSPIWCGTNPASNISYTNGTADGDTDGMADRWEYFHFTSLARAGHGDYDQDGINDRDEFVSGKNPLSAADGSKALFNAAQLDALFYHLSQ